MHRLFTTLLVVLAAWPLAAQRYPDAQEDGHFAGADGVRLFYQEAGTGIRPPAMWASPQRDSPHNAAT